MTKMVFAKGKSIYKAMVEGSKRGFNRTTNNYAKYEELISDTYDIFVNRLNSKDRCAVERNTDGDWREAYLGVHLVKFHEHIAGEPSERHARIILRGDESNPVDVPIEYWNYWEMLTEELHS